MVGGVGLFLYSLEGDLEDESVAVEAGCVVGAEGIVTLAGIGSEGVVVKLPRGAKLPDGLAKVGFVFADEC